MLSTLLLLASIAGAQGVRMNLPSISSSTAFGAFVQKTGDTMTGVLVSSRQGSGNLTDITQALTWAGLQNVGSNLDLQYRPLVYGSFSNSNATKPQVGIWWQNDNNFGTSLYFGTSNSFSTGITKTIQMDYLGNLISGSSITTTGGLFGTTLTASKIIASPRTSTMTPTGLLFFASSSTISGSTFTATGPTFFSTYTLTANEMQVGDRLVVECLFQNSEGTVSGPFQMVNTSYANEIAYTQVATANQLVLVRGEITLISATAATSLPSARSIAPAGTGADFAANPNGASGILPFDPAASQTVGCEGRATSGGTVNFLWMRVRKD